LNSHAIKPPNINERTDPIPWILEIADSLTDILYVTYGAGYAYGIDLDKCFKEVQRANMSKLGEDGKPIYNEKGKVMKGPNYLEPNLKQFVE
jgi:predicted HAD superfamily Cof-like phosphohydrolase